MSRSNANGTPLRAALKATTHRRELVSKAVAASQAEHEVLDVDPDTGREDEEDGDPTGPSRGFVGGPFGG